MSENNSNIAQKSYSFKVPILIQWVYKVIEKIHVKWATSFAIALFFKPIRFPMPDREKKPSRTAHQDLMWVGGKKITVYRWGTRKARVLCVHGWSGRGTQFFKFAKKLEKAGFQVISFDAPGHGAYPNNRTDLFQFVEAIKIIDQKYGPFYAGIGHSLGGVALMNAHAQGVSFKKMITIASPATVMNSITDFCTRLGAKPELANRIKSLLEKKYQIDVQSFSLQNLAEKCSVKGLIIHDADDLDVAVDDAHAVHQSWKKSLLLLTEGLGHRKILMDKQTLKTVSNFLAKKLR